MNATITRCLAAAAVSVSTLAAAESQRTSTDRRTQTTTSPQQSSVDYAEAIKAALAEYKKSKRGYRPNAKLGYLYYMNREYDKSVLHYGKAMKASRSSVEAKLGCMLPLLAQREFAKVESLARAVRKTDRHNYYANLRQSIALRYLGKFSQAELVAKRMLRLYPSDVNFLIEKAFALGGQRKHSESRKVFEQVLTISPNNPVAQYHTSAEAQQALPLPTRLRSSRRRR